MNGRGVVQRVMRLAETELDYAIERQGVEDCGEVDKDEEGDEGVDAMLSRARWHWRRNWTLRRSWWEQRSGAIIVGHSSWRKKASLDTREIVYLKA